MPQIFGCGTGSILSGSATMRYHSPIAYGARGYGIASIGVYHTRIELDQALPYYGGYGYGYPEAVAASHVTNFGWDAGAGLEFALSSGHFWFLEGRYQRISSSRAVTYLPIEACDMDPIVEVHARDNK